MKPPMPTDRIYKPWNIANNGWLYPEERKRYHDELLGSPTDERIAEMEDEMNRRIKDRYDAWNLGN